MAPLARLATVAVAAGSWIAFRPLSSPTAPFSPVAGRLLSGQTDPAKPIRKPDSQQANAAPGWLRSACRSRPRPPDAEIQGLLEAWLRQRRGAPMASPRRPPGELARPPLVASLRLKGAATWPGETQAGEG